MPRLQIVLEADSVLAISETTRKDLLRIFGLPPNKIVNINGGFTKIADKSRKPKKFKIPRRFVLFPTGDLPHKNNQVAVRGFEYYRQNSSADISLLITSNFHTKTKEELQKISKHIVFTENVPDEELEWLYENADAVLFASQYEGLGMPILDAVASQKPIITSHIPVFEEMSKKAFYFFEADRPRDLAAAMQAALQSDTFSSKLSHYTTILKKCTWANTCQSIITSINSLPEKLESPKPKIEQPKVAVACLHPGISNQIGRVAESLHYSLRQCFEVDYFFDANGYHYREMERPSFLDFFDNKTFDITKLTLQSYKKYDAVIYLIDEAALPSRLAQRACVLPGIAIVGALGRIDAQQRMLKDIITSNQSVVSLPGKLAYPAYKKLARELARRVDNLNAYPDAARTIINNGAILNRSIINRLISLRHDE